MIVKYVKLPVVIEAVLWDGTNVDEIFEFVGHNAEVECGELFIDTLEGAHVATIGDYIIKGVEGEFYPCKPSIFQKTYREER